MNKYKSRKWIYYLNMKAVPFIILFSLKGD